MASPDPYTVVPPSITTVPAPSTTAGRVISSVTHVPTPVHNGLAFTGSDTIMLVGIALLLIILGTLAIILHRKKNIAS